jgi:hypothetical protein
VMRSGRLSNYHFERVECDGALAEGGGGELG